MTIKKTDYRKYKHTTIFKFRSTYEKARLNFHLETSLLCSILINFHYNVSTELVPVVYWLQSRTTGRCAGSSPATGHTD